MGDSQVVTKHRIYRDSPTDCYSRGGGGGGGGVGAGITGFTDRPTDCYSPGTKHSFIDSIKLHVYIKL